MAKGEPFKWTTPEGWGWGEEEPMASRRNRVPRSLTKRFFFSNSFFLFFFVRSPAVVGVNSSTTTSLGPSVAASGRFRFHFYFIPRRGTSKEMERNDGGGDDSWADATKGRAKGKP